MTTDVRTLLHDAADAPSQAPNIDGALRSARDRRRRQRGVGGLATVVVIALITGALALGAGGGDEARVAIGPRQVASEIPDGWKTVHADPGITVSVPPAWKVSPASATPIGVPVLSLEDLSPNAEDVLAECTLGRTPSGAPEEGGSLINMWEFPASSSEVPGTANDVLNVVDRPTTFSGALTLGPRTCPAAEYQQIAFRDAGRVFMVRAVSVIPPNAENPELLALAVRVLDTLRIEPLRTDPTATTAGPVVIPENPRITAPTTTLPPFVPSTTDEQAINALFVAWLKDHPDDETRRIVEDADALLDSIHQGLAQHTAADLAGYSGTVSAIRMLDADHAEVQYTLLHSGQPQFGLRTGVAVRVDGHWMVSRATECALLSLGGITCPPE